MNDKKFAKMDKVKLLELLCQLTEENETLTKRVAGMEEANAELTLRRREMETRAGEEQARAEKCAEELQAAKNALKEAEDARAALPMGSFADAVLHSYEIAQRTQAAADEYMVACQRKLQEAEEKAAETMIRAEETAAKAVQEAEEKAEELVRQAQDKAEATFRSAEEHLAQKTAEAEELLCKAQEEAAEAVRQAEERCKAMAERENEIRHRLRAEVEGLNQMMARLDGVNV